MSQLVYHKCKGCSEELLAGDWCIDCYKLKRDKNQKSDKTYIGMEDYSWYHGDTTSAGTNPFTAFTQAGNATNTTPTTWKTNIPFTSSSGTAVGICFGTTSKDKSRRIHHEGTYT